MKEQTELWTVKELAKYLNYTDRTIYSLIKEAGLPVIEIRGRFRFRKSEIDKWLESQRAHSERGGER